jgi:hypothetical protein
MVIEINYFEYELSLRYSGKRYIAPPAGTLHSQSEDAQLIAMAGSGEEWGNLINK